MLSAPIRPLRDCRAFLLAVLTLFGVSTIARAGDAALKNTTPSITTTGSASAEVAPNIATISLGVVTERASASEAAADNARAAQAIAAEIKAEGIDPNDIRTIAATLIPVYEENRDANGRFIRRSLRGFSARNELSVRVRNVALVGGLARRLIEKGANSFGGVEFDLEPKEEKYDVLRAAAVRDAQRKANAYAGGLGLKLGRVLEIAPAQPHAFAAAPMARAAQADSAESGMPIEPGLQTLRTEVEVSWELVQP